MVSTVVLLLILCLFLSLSLSAAVTVPITLVVNTFLIPRSSKPVLGLNGTSPGPTIYATEGDTLVIRVINQLNKPTALHWHGILQQNSTFMDGSVGISQCAIPAGSQFVYRFVASASGTYWYHGHIHEQYTDGLFGALIIYPVQEPYAANYSRELIWAANDWYNSPASTLTQYYMSSANIGGIEPEPDSIQLNGLFTTQMRIPVNRTESVRVRFINAAAFSAFKISIDGLILTIIEIDSQMVQPYRVSSFMIDVGQRVSFLLHLGTIPDEIHSRRFDYIRVQAVLSMYPVDILTYAAPYSTPVFPYPSFFNPLWLGVFQFEDTMNLNTSQIQNDVHLHGGMTSTGLPSSQLSVPVLPTPSVQDVNILDARPLQAISVPPSTHYLPFIVSFRSDSNGILRAYMNGITYSNIQTDFQPTTMSMPDADGGGDTGGHGSMNAMNNMRMTAILAEDSIINNATVPTQTETLLSLIQLGGAVVNQLQKPVTMLGNLSIIKPDEHGRYYLPLNAVIEVFINNTDPAPHPFHLHGHTFWIISTSEYTSAEQIYQGNWVQRDTVTVPGKGWAKLRFVANNPGIWLFHCHVDWHMAAGLAAILIEAPELLLHSAGFHIPTEIEQQCQLASQMAASHTTSTNAAAIGIGIGIGIAVLLLAIGSYWFVNRPRDKIPHSVI